MESEAVGTPEFSGASSEHMSITLNGAILKVGSITVTSTGDTTITFDQPFKQQILYCTATLIPDTGGSAYLKSFTTTGMVITNSGGSKTLTYMAIGV